MLFLAASRHGHQTRFDLLLEAPNDGFFFLRSIATAA
jgi:hypothetical protein